MIVQLNEVTNLTSKMVPHGEGRFEVSEQEQRLMLASFLNVAESFLASRAELARQGLNVPYTLSGVTLTYSKVTKAKARIAGRDYAGIPGVAYDTHQGNVIKVARNREGRLYFTVSDNNRAGERTGFTAIRLEGVRTFAFSDAGVQRAALAKAREAVAV